MALTFGAWIKQTREERGWTVQRCANISGLRWQVWARLERDEPRTQSGKAPQRRRDTVVAVARGLDVDEAEAFAAAGFRKPASGARETRLEADTPLFEAIAQLDARDKQALQALVAHLKTRRRVPVETPLPVSVEPSRPVGPRTVGIDLDSGYLRDPEGKILSEAQLPRIAEAMGQLAAIYARSHYALSEADSILAQMRQELQVPDLPVENHEESRLPAAEVQA